MPLIAWRSTLRLQLWYAVLHLERQACRSHNDALQCKDIQSCVYEHLTETKNTGTMQQGIHKHHGCRAGL